MSQDCLRPVVCEREQDSMREFLSIKDYSQLNPFPSLATIFRKPGGKWRSSGSDSEDVYLHCITTVTNAVAEEVRFNAQGKRLVVDQQSFLIPLEYDGWFEVLSQDGRSTRPIETVRELSSLEVQSPFLVRQTTKGYRQTGDRTYAVEVIREGTVLKTQETLQSSARQIAADDSRDMELIKGPILKCLDHQGKQIYLALDARGLFSPLACRSRIVGAHDICSLLEKFRLPVLVRLIHGNISDSAKSVERTPQIFRLVGKRSEELAFVLLLNNSKLSGKDACQMLPLPANDKYLLSSLKTMDSEEMQSLQKNCALHISNFKNAIRLSSAQRRHWLMPDRAINGLDLIQRNRLNNTNNGDSDAPCALSGEEQQLFREIEDLYAAVRNPRHPQTIPTPRLQKQDHTETAAAETSTRFPKSFKMAPFSDESFVGRPLLFSRNLVFHGHLEKLNLKQTYGIRNEFYKRSPAMGLESLRFAKTSNRDDGRTELGTSRMRTPRAGGTRSLNASKENLYAETSALRPCCNTAGKESQWTHSTLSKHKLELVKAQRGGGADDTEKTTKYTKVPRILHHHHGAGDDEKRGEQRSAFDRQTNNGSAANSTRDWKGTAMDDQMDNQDNNTKITVFKDKTRFQKESNCDQTSFIINDQTVTWRTRPVLLRPKSYAGKPHADHLLTAFLGPATTLTAQSPAPPPPPPRRVASLSEVNVLSELQQHSRPAAAAAPTVSTHASSNHLRPDHQRRMSTSAAVLPVYRDVIDASCGGGNFNRNLSTSKTLGNASRSLINNIRRIGNNKSTVDRSLVARESELFGNLTTCFRPQQRLRIRSINDDVITTHV